MASIRLEIMVMVGLISPFLLPDHGEVMSEIERNSPMLNFLALCHFFKA